MHIHMHIHMRRKILALALTLAITVAMFVAAPLTASAATGMAHINISALGASYVDNSGSPTESQWAYYGGGANLYLKTANGQYTLTGSNANLAIKVSGVDSATNVNVTLNNISASAPSVVFHDDSMGCTLTLVGNNTLISGGMHGFDASADCIITSTTGGSLSATGGTGYSGLNLGAPLSITGNATVTSVGMGDYGMIFAPNQVSIGDNAKLTITNGFAGGVEPHTIQKAGTSTTHKWKLTNVTLVSGALTDGSIGIAIPAGQTGTIEREPIPAAPVAPLVTSNTLPSGKVGTLYNQTLAATGDAPITWTLESGSLPNGLSLSPSGAISGTPATSGNFNFTVKASNGAGSDTKALAILIAAADPIVNPTTTYTVSFADGSNALSTVTVEQGQLVPQPKAIPQKAGHTFIGWYADAACTSRFDFATAKVTGNTTIYAYFFKNPAKVAAKTFKVTSPKKKQAKVAYQKVSNASGYEVVFGLKKAAVQKVAAPAGANKFYAGSKLTASKKGLKSGKTYYFKVRVYATVQGVKCYSDWTALKKVKIK